MLWGDLWVVHKKKLLHCSIAKAEIFFGSHWTHKQFTQSKGKSKTKIRRFSENVARFEWDRRRVIDTRVFSPSRKSKVLCSCCELSRHRKYFNASVEKKRKRKKKKSFCWVWYKIVFPPSILASYFILFTILWWGKQK